MNTSQTFARNNPIIMPKEQEMLAGKTVFFAGLGAIGQAAFTHLIRMGLGKAVVADHDAIDESNINRQPLARISTINRKKAELAREFAADINPNAEVKVYSEGVTLQNINEIIDGADLIVEGIDINGEGPTYSVLVHRAARERGITVVSAVEVAFGAVIFVYDPKGYTFEKQFKLSSETPIKEVKECKTSLTFFVPTLPRYIALDDFIRVMKGELKSPAVSTGASSAGVLLANESFQILAKRSGYKSVIMPKYIWFDSAINKYSVRDYRVDSWILEKRLQINKMLKQKRERGAKNELGADHQPGSVAEHTA